MNQERAVARLERLNLATAKLTKRKEAPDAKHAQLDQRLEEYAAEKTKITAELQKAHAAENGAPA